VAEWGEKGTRVNRHEEDSFEEDHEQESGREREEDRAQLDLIKKKIEEKITKFEHSGSFSNPTKNTLNSLQSKALELQEMNKETERKRKQGENSNREEKEQTSAGAHDCTNN
jgi:hypothetical protein